MVTSKLYRNLDSRKRVENFGGNPLQDEGLCFLNFPYTVKTTPSLLVSNGSRNTGKFSFVLNDTHFELETST